MIATLRPLDSTNVEAAIRKAYARNLDRIFDSHNSPQQKELARRALGFVREAARPFTIRELQWLLSTTDRTPFPDHSDLYKWEDIKSCCHGMIEGDGLNYVNFSHRTLHQNLSRDQELDRVPLQHNELCRRCLDHLNNGDLSSGICRNPEELEQRWLSLPLIDYAARYWQIHFTKSSGGLVGMSAKHSRSS